MDRVMKPKPDRDMRIILKHSRLLCERMKKAGVEVKFNMTFRPIRKAKRSRRANG